MALQAFHSNPNIGGFGNENTAAELLILGEPASKPSGRHRHRSFMKNRSRPQVATAGTNVTHPTTFADESSGDALCQIVKELVDNAVDACETARKHRSEDEDTSKLYRVKVELLPYNKTGSGKGDDDDDTTLQRLVPGTYSCITSATKEAPSFKRCLYFVDTAGDTVECHREEEVEKGHPDESGTCVSLLVPGRSAAKAAWKRLESYLRRFQLSSVQCSIEALAPTLSNVPLHVVRAPVRNIAPSLSQDTQSSKELNEALDIEDCFDNDSSDENHDHERRTQRNQQSSSSSTAFLAERTNVQVMAQKYGFFQNPLQLQNIAHSQHTIRTASVGGLSERMIGPIPPDPKLTVDMVVSPHEEGDLNHESSSHESSSWAAARLELVRMVNSVPLLDGAESFVCGLVKALQSSAVWGSFGLTFLGTSASDELQDSWTNSFAIRDSDQVAPFFQTNKHQLWENEQEEYSEGYAGEDEGIDPKKRSRMKSETTMMPAKIRLGKILILVDIVAVPSMLPLPTLSKGRLPINHLPITQAFHLGLRDCLRSLQLTSPGLLLTSVQLRTVERDVRYIPSVASAATNILWRMQDQTKHLRLLRKVKQMHDEDPSNLDSSRDPELPFPRGEMIRTIEQRTVAAIFALEIAKKQKRKRTKSTKQNETDNDDYSEFESSDVVGPSISTVVSPEASSQLCRVHSLTMERPAHDDDSYHSASSWIESSTQNNDRIKTLLPCATSQDSDDDEWW